jgi:hypothetical protein
VLLDVGAAAAAIDLSEQRGGRHKAVDVVADEPGLPVEDDSGTAPRRVASTGVPHALASIMAMPKGSSQSWQSYRNTFVCNGKPQTATVTVGKIEEGSKGTLKAGVA